MSPDEILAGTKPLLKRLETAKGRKLEVL